jgi:hypothetical protein
MKIQMQVTQEVEIKEVVKEVEQALSDANLSLNMEDPALIGAAIKEAFSIQPETGR